MAGFGHARPAHLRDVQQALDPAAQIDEGAVGADRDDPAGKVGAGHDGAADLLGDLPLFFLEDRAPGDDQVLAVTAELDDAEGVDLPLVNRGVFGEGVVDLRDRAEGALSADTDLEAALDRLLDPPLDGEPGPVSVVQLLARGGASGQLVRQLQSAPGGDDDALDDVADLHVEIAVGVDQLLEVDGRLALAPDVDEGDLLADGDDPALDRLAFLEDNRLEGRLEHALEVLFLGEVVAGLVVGKHRGLLPGAPRVRLAVHRNEEGRTR